MDRYQKLKAQFILLDAIREFFKQQDFQDVLTPPAVPNPGMETHIHPFQLYSTYQKDLKSSYLHTSPEFCMKELLSLGFENIFTLSYCFRDEPSSPIHRNQFIMLEWYRVNQYYTQIMDDMENLIQFSLEYLHRQDINTKKTFENVQYQRVTIQELFQEFLHIDILQFLNREDLYQLIKHDFSDIALPHPTKETYAWDDLYFLLFLNKIETELVNFPYILLYEFPHHLSALSTIKESDPRVCERFEVYLNGIELCNCFNELCNIEEQKRRFAFQAEEKNSLYNYSLPQADVLFSALERGLPTSTGIALGVERLLTALTPIENSFWN